MPNLSASKSPLSVHRDRALDTRFHVLLCKERFWKKACAEGYAIYDTLLTTRPFARSSRITARSVYRRRVFDIHDTILTALPHAQAVLLATA